MMRSNPRPIRRPGATDDTKGKSLTVSVPILARSEDRAQLPPAKACALGIVVPILARSEDRAQLRPDYGSPQGHVPILARSEDRAQRIKRFRNLSV